VKSPFLTCTVGKFKVHYRFQDLEGRDLPMHPRMQVFARRYIQHWIKKYDSPPRLYHKLPFQYRATFLLNFAYDDWLWAREHAGRG
jgi:hypothetical protein